MEMFKCRICRADCFGLTNYTACLEVHVHQRNFKWYCPLCPYAASTKKRYHVHVKKCLSRAQAPIPQASIPTTQAQSTDIMWTCGTCDAVIKVTGTPCCEDFERVATHVRTCFKKHENMKIKTDCPVARCGRSYTAYRTLCHHLKSHKDLLAYELICQANKPEENRLPEEDILMECPEFDNDDHIHEESTSRNSAPEENKRRQEGQEQSSCASVELRNSRLSFRESYFALKLLSKDLLPREVLNEIFQFYEQSTDEKVSITLQALSESNLLDEDDLKDVEYFVRKMFRIIGTNGALGSVKRRDTHLHNMFKFLQPRRMLIGEKNGRSSDFYYIPPEEILSRLLMDEGYRRYSVIHPEHMITKKGPRVYESITSGNVFQSMIPSVKGPTLVLRLYIDAFGINNPLGSSADKDKIVGFYFTAVHHHKVAAQRSSIQTLALYRSSDIAAFGIDKCLEVPVKDLRRLVENGMSPTITGHPRYNVRVSCVLGDNLGLNEIVGIVMNFSTVEHSCRRCLLSRTTLKTAKKYEEIHFKNNERRTLESLRADYQEKVEENVPHIHCVQNESVLIDFPHLDITVATPQCYSHDLLEGCLKQWMLLIVQHFVHQNWISWDSLEDTMRAFKYKGSDANNRPPAMKAKKMKRKDSRKIVGTFAEVSTLVRLFPQLLFDHISDPQDPLWQFYLKVRGFLQYVQMPRISESQVNELDELLIELMNQRMELTREPNDKPPGFRYVPPLTYKEHFLSHYKSDIKNFGSLTGTATDRFEANHSPFKRIKERKRQSVNVLKTLFQNNENLRTYYSTSTFEIPLDPSVKGPANDEDVLVLAKEKHIDTSCFYECRRVTLHGTLYRPDRYMVRNKTEREHPNEYVFCLIKEIYVTDNIKDNRKTCYLYVQQATQGQLARLSLYTVCVPLYVFSTPYIFTSDKQLL